MRFTETVRLARRHWFVPRWLVLWLVLWATIATFVIVWAALMIRQDTNVAYWYREGKGSGEQELMDILNDYERDLDRFKNENQTLRAMLRRKKP